jgi:hypothetical protein
MRRAPKSSPKRVSTAGEPTLVLLDCPNFFLVLANVPVQERLDFGDVGDPDSVLDIRGFQSKEKDPNDIMES